MADLETPAVPAAQPTAPPQAAKCLVCGGSIQPGNLVGCTSCDTPHHRDCFEYNGRCAVYACGATSYILKWKAMGREQTRHIQAGTKAAGAAPDGGPAARGGAGAAAGAAARAAADVRAGAIGPTDAARYGRVEPHERQRLRRQEALGEHEIRIESASLARSLGISVMTFGGVLGAAFSGLGAPETAGCGCNALEGLGSAGEGAGLLIVLVAAGIALWFLLAAVIPGLLQLIGAILYWFVSSYWTVDKQRRLVLRGRIFGIPFWHRRWPADRAQAVAVGPVRPNGYNWLVVRFHGGRQVFLADNRQHARMGYDTSDLTRMGRRLAEALGARYERIEEQPDLPTAPSE